MIQTLLSSIVDWMLTVNSWAIMMAFALTIVLEAASLIKEIYGKESAFLFTASIWSMYIMFGLMLLYIILKTILSFL